MHVQVKLSYSPRELSDLTGLSSSTIARRLKDNTIPYTRLGRRILISAAWADALFARKEA
jgi:excisionase family DNA binding protein